MGILNRGATFVNKDATEITESIELINGRNFSCISQIKIKDFSGFKTPQDEAPSLLVEKLERGLRKLRLRVLLKNRRFEKENNFKLCL